MELTHVWSFCAMGKKPKRVVLGSVEYGRGFKLKKKKKFSFKKTWQVM